MAAAEQKIRPARTPRITVSFLFERFSEFISSVRFGIILLCLLVLFSMIGMLIMQQNVEGFDAFYVSLTPAEKIVYGRLGFFDIYHSWYFNFLLLILSLNIILASIDHFPAAWSYIVDPMRTATRNWLDSQKEHTAFTVKAESIDDITQRVSSVFSKTGFTPVVSETQDLQYGVDADGKKDFSVITEHRSHIVFGQRGKWNRLGAYIVHTFLLTLFLGHFVALRTGFDADLRLEPGVVTDQIQMIEYNLDQKSRYNVQLPFNIECTDIQQTLINPGGAIDVTNTLDWRTQMKIEDPQYGTRIANVSLNEPYTYRGYRFFQAQTIPLGSARNATIELTPQKGGEPLTIDLARGASTTLVDGTKVTFSEFQPDFTFGSDGKPTTRSGDYNNPVAILTVKPDGQPAQSVFAFAQKLGDNVPVAAPKLGYKWHLANFEKVPSAHVLSIKYDPFDGAFIAWYIGGFGLIAALGFVFFISHQRLWVRIEPTGDGRYEILAAGHTNRNPFGFEDKFKQFVEDLRGELG
ncbi:MAG: cytochrome c biogenesis protein ResB [Chloracidobacterium sp.]|nr:cytochrome c biogenesis protein ResB [Chloracidobacterium sp.]MCC6824298.1 cytochrome c biogenesis protein ResB [Acidobacteriota bacterium]MCO5334917.1 cytochrome c biogenesis protein ResB [Pyrinomonadaceae bacterium]